MRQPEDTIMPLIFDTAYMSLGLWEKFSVLTIALKRKGLGGFGARELDFGAPGLQQTNPATRNRTLKTCTQKS